MSASSYEAAERRQNVAPGVSPGFTSADESSAVGATDLSRLRHAARLRMRAAILCVALFSTSPAFSQTIHYSLAMPQPAAHLFHVEMTIDQPGASAVDLALPAWNGLYQIRDFSQFVQNLQANVPFKRIDKQTWRFDTGNTPQLKV